METLLSVLTSSTRSGGTDDDDDDDVMMLMAMMMNIKLHPVMMMVIVMITIMPTVRISLSWLSAQAWFGRQNDRTVDFPDLDGQGAGW